MFFGMIRDLFLTKKTSDFALAKSLLGEDFISPEQVAEACAVSYSKEDAEALIESLPSEEVIRECKDNGFAVLPSPPTVMSASDVLRTWPDYFYHVPGDIKDFTCTGETSLGWLTIGKMPVVNSINKNWEDQTKLLAEFEMIPNAAEAIWFVTTYFRVRGIKLFEEIFVKTSSTYPNGDHVVIGRFLPRGMVIEYSPGEHKSRHLGLLAGRKF